MSTCKILIEKEGYIPEIHEGLYPEIESCVICEKNNIINVILKTTKNIMVYDDIGYDENGRYICISYHQWHNKINGKEIEEHVLLDEDESYYNDYEIVLTNIKIYKKFSYSSIVSYNGKITEISLIPYKIINFNENNCDNVLYKV